MENVIKSSQFNGLIVDTREYPNFSRNNLHMYPDLLKRVIQADFAVTTDGEVLKSKWFSPGWIVTEKKIHDELNMAANRIVTKTENPNYKLSSPINLKKLEKKSKNSGRRR